MEGHINRNVKDHRNVVLLVLQHMWLRIEDYHPFCWSIVLHGTALSGREYTVANF